MITTMAASALLNRLGTMPERGPRFRKRAVEALSGLPGYDWCGIYRLEAGELVLDEFEGAPTEHTRIAVGSGVCGTAVKEGRNQVVEDVRKLENYLACSVATRSEIVVLIRQNGNVLGQIDIDGHSVGTFEKSDEWLLDRLAEMLAERWDN